MPASCRILCCLAFALSAAAAQLAAEQTYAGTKSSAAAAKMAD